MSSTPAAWWRPALRSAGSVVRSAVRYGGSVLTIALAFGLILAIGVRGTEATAKPRYDVPHDAKMEATLGIRFTQAAVVGDGGLVELRYVVLDAEKATAFQSDTKHPPRLVGERNKKIAWRAALMRQGHELRPGQSYFLLYLNNQHAVHPGDMITIQTGTAKLAHVPVR
jgi:hypothetical protein